MEPPGRTFGAPEGERHEIWDNIRRWSDTGLNFVPGGAYFFTVTLADRISSALVHHVSDLRMAFRID
jgi:hypothetical protein